MVDGFGVQELPGLVLTYWWVKLGPGTSASPLVGRARSWGLYLQDSGVPELVSDCW